MHEGINNFDLMSTNEIVHHSEVQEIVNAYSRILSGLGQLMCVCAGMLKCRISCTCLPFCEA